MVASLKNNKFVKKQKRKNLWVFALFFILTSIFLYPIFFGKVFFPGDLLYQLPPWSLSNSSVLKDVLPINNPLLGDPVTAFYPWYTFMGRALSEGYFPLWNPFVMAGAPFLANWQSGALALENLVFYFLKTPIALNISIFSKIFLALSFMYIFLRKIRLSKEASVFGAITFTFSAFFIVWLNWPQTRVALWLPLILFTIEHLLERPQLQRSAYVSLAIGAAFFAGHPGTIVMILMVVFVYSLFRIVLSTNRAKKTLYLTVGVILGLGMGALLILPGYEMMKGSYQFGQRKATDYLKTSLDPGSAIMLFFPYFYGHLKDGIYIGRANFNEISAYIGLLPLFFGFWALTTANKLKRSWPLLSLVFFAATLIFGLWPQSMLYRLPLVSMQPTQRYIFILTFALAVLGALGFDSFFDDEKRTFRLTILSILFFVALLVFSIKANPVIKDIYSFYVFLLPLSYIALLAAHFFGKKSWLKPVLIGVLFFNLFIFGFGLNTYINEDYVYSKSPVFEFLKKDKSVNRVLPLAYTVMPNSLMSFGIQDLRGRDALISKSFVEFSNLIKDPYSQPQLPNYILPNKIESPLIDFLNVKYIISEIPVGNTLPRKVIGSKLFDKVYNEIGEVYNEKFQGQTFKAKEDNLSGVGVLVGTFKRPLNPTRVKFKLHDSSGKVLREKYFPAAYFRDNSYAYFDFEPVSNSVNKNFSFVLEGRDIPKKFRTAIYLSGIDQYPDGDHFSHEGKKQGDLAFYPQYKESIPKYKAVYRYENLTVYKNTKSLARAFAVQEYLVIPSSKKALAYLGSERIDPRTQVVLRKKPNYYGDFNNYDGTQKVEITEYKPNYISIDVRLRKKSIVVISDNYDPGWNAFVEGVKVPIYLANTSFRAVALKKGKHKLRLVYAPESIRNGLALSVFAFILAISFIVYPAIKKRIRAKLVNRQE